MIPLWEQEIPGYDPSLEQGIPGLTPYLLKGDGSRAAVIVCPGGGYYMRAPHEGEPVALWLNTLGISAFVLNYRVHPYGHPYPMLDGQRSVRLVRARAAEFGIDPKRIGMLGFSAGGHLTATVGTHFDGGVPQGEDLIDQHSSRPDALVLCYPAISFQSHFHLGSKEALLGTDPPEALIQYLSNETQVRVDTPPAFLWHTADDSGVPVENSLLFAAALRQCGVPFALHVFPHGRHGVGLAQDHPALAVWTDLCAAWLAQIGFCMAQEATA